MIYSTHQAKTHLSRLLKEAEAGAEVVIAKGKRTIARLVAVKQEGQKDRPKVGVITSKPVRKVDKQKCEDEPILYF